MARSVGRWWGRGCRPAAAQCRKWAPRPGRAPPPPPPPAPPLCALQVCVSYKAKCIVIRSLSDLAGGDADGNQVGNFFGMASYHSSLVLSALVAVA